MTDREREILEQMRAHTAPLWERDRDVLYYDLIASAQYLASANPDAPEALRRWAEESHERLSRLDLPLDLLRLPTGSFDPRTAPLVYYIHDVDVPPDDGWLSIPLPHLQRAVLGESSDRPWAEAPRVDWPALVELRCVPHGGRGPALADWLAGQRLPSLRRLTMTGCLDAARLDRLQRTLPGWAELEQLRLAGNDLRGLHGLPSMPALIELDLSRCNLVRDDGAALRGGRFPRLRSLRLASNILESAILDHLRAMDAPCLEELDITDTWLYGPETWRGLVALGDERPLRRLHLTLQDAGPIPDPAGVKGLLRPLHALTVSGHLTDEHLAALLPPSLPELRRLDLQVNALTPGGAEQLARADLPALTELDLSHNRELGDAGVAALVRAPWWPRLRVAALHNVGLGEHGRRLLAEATRPGQVIHV